MPDTICKPEIRIASALEFDHDQICGVLVAGCWIGVETGSFEIHYSHQIDSPQGLMPDDTFVSFINGAGRMAAVRLDSIDAFEFCGVED